MSCEEKSSCNNKHQYVSWVDGIKEARMQEKEPTQFVKKAGRSVYYADCNNWWFGAMLGIPLSMTIVGATNLENCPVNRMIPIWMIVSGSATMLWLFLSLLDKIINKCQKPDKDSEDGQSFRGLMSLIGVFQFAWLITGSVWVYPQYRPDTNAESANYCKSNLYYYAFSMITIAYIVMFLFFCGCCAFCAKIKPTENQPTDVEAR